MTPADSPSVRPTFRPAEGGASQEAGTLVLRDGRRYPLWRVLPEDVRRVEAFLEGLPTEEREDVAAALRLGPDELPDFVQGFAGRERGEGFLAEAPEGGRMVAFGAYRLLEEGRVAAITIAVSPGHRERGIGRLLVERLAVLAAHRGADQLEGLLLPRNRRLIELFRRSGFELAEEQEAGRTRVVTSVSSLTPREPRAPEPDLAARVFTAASLRPLFYPRSVAVVGASRDPESVGHRILLSLLRGRFNGTVYPVNPKADQVASVEAHASVEELEGEIDLGVVAVPAPLVPEVAAGCADAGARGLVVVSAGFAEVGEEGRDLQEELVEVVRDRGMRMVGPNCLGLLHTRAGVRLNASFAPAMPPTGRVGLCSQSGALGIAIIALAERVQLGLSSFVSVGNKADVGGDDLLEYWEEDPGTDVLLFYLESFKRSRRFARVARRVGRTKPIVVVKSGRTEAGERAASSHTAALTASEPAVDALFRQTGIIRADTLTEMFGIARTLTEQPLPGGRSVAVVTNAGGPAILCADALEAADMQVGPLSEGTRETLESFLPAAAATGNPVDMIASAGPESYRRAVETVLSAPEVDAAVAIYTPVGMFEMRKVSRAIRDGVRAARANGGAGKPVLASVVGSEEEIEGILPAEGEGGGPDGPGEGDLRIPAFSFPEEIAELDMNPVFALEPGEGYRTVDARMRVHPA